jgi:hypothetical protein
LPPNLFAVFVYITTEGLSSSLHFEALSNQVHQDSEDSQAKPRQDNHKMTARQPQAQDKTRQHNKRKHKLTTMCHKGSFHDGNSNDILRS